MAQSDNVLTKVHVLILYMVPQMAKFQRDRKFTLGDHILAKLLEVQERCIRAYQGREKRAHLEGANVAFWGANAGDKQNGAGGPGNSGERPAGPACSHPDSSAALP